MHLDSQGYTIRPVPPVLCDRAVPSGQSEDRHVPSRQCDDRAVPSGLSGDRAVPSRLSKDRAVPPVLTQDRPVPSELSEDRAVPPVLTEDRAVPSGSAVAGPSPDFLNTFSMKVIFGCVKACFARRPATKLSTLTRSLSPPPCF